MAIGRFGLKAAASNAASFSSTLNAQPQTQSSSLVSKHLRIGNWAKFQNGAIFEQLLSGLTEDCFAYSPTLAERLQKEPKRPTCHAKLDLSSYKAATTTTTPTLSHSIQIQLSPALSIYLSTVLAQFDAKSLDSRVMWLASCVLRFPNDNPPRKTTKIAMGIRWRRGRRWRWWRRATTTEFRHFSN